MKGSVFEGVSAPVRTAVYVKKGGNGDYEDYVMVSAVKGDTVEFFNPFRDSFTMTVKEFNKKYKKGTEEDFTVFEEVNCVKCIRINESVYPVVSEGGTKYLCVSENGDRFAIDKSEVLFSLTESGELNEASAQLSVVNKGVDKDGLLLVVNGKDYHYTSSELTPKQLEDKYVSIAKHSVGTAYAWIKKNSKAKESYKKAKPKMSSQELNQLEIDLSNLQADILGDPSDYFSGKLSAEGELSYRGTVGKSYTLYNEITVMKWSKIESDDVPIGTVELGFTVNGDAYPLECEAYAKSDNGASDKKSFVLKANNWDAVTKSLQRWYKSYCSKASKYFIARSGNDASSYATNIAEVLKKVPDKFKITVDGRNIIFKTNKLAMLPRDSVMSVGAYVECTGDSELWKGYEQAADQWDFVDAVLEELDKLRNKYGFDIMMKPRGRDIDDPLAGWFKDFKVTGNNFSDQEEVNDAVRPYLEKFKIESVDERDSALEEPY